MNPAHLDCPGLINQCLGQLLAANVVVAPALAVDLVKHGAQFLQDFKIHARAIDERLCGNWATHHHVQRTHRPSVQHLLAKCQQHVLDELR